MQQDYKKKIMHGVKKIYMHISRAFYDICNNTLYIQWGAEKLRTEQYILYVFGWPFGTWTLNHRGILLYNPII